MLLNDRDLEKDFVQIYSEHILAGIGDPLLALVFADQYSLRPLQGACHYAYLISKKKKRPKQFGVSKLGPDDIEEGFRRRLLAGHWSLMEACESLYEFPPLKKKTCKKFRINKWYTEWSRELEFESSDPLFLLRQLRSKLEDELEDEEDSEVGDEDEDEVFKELDEVIQIFQDNLMDHFEV
jgi:hypothetical protein